MSKDERTRLFKERAILKRQKAEMFSLWCDALYRLSLANHVCFKKMLNEFFNNLKNKFSFVIKYSGCHIIWIFEVEFIHVLLT